MTPYSPSDERRPDLRERRRRQMTRVIANAAVELFERQGFQATTIEEIAEVAGISRTTFFRHCPTKESAVLVDDAGFAPELVAVASQAERGGELRALEQAWERMAVGFDDDHEGHDRFRRVRRLMRDTPQLHAAGLERDALLTAQIADALQDGPGLRRLEAAAIAERFTMGLRLTFDEWLHRVEKQPGAVVPLLDVYRDARAAFARAEGAGS